MLCNNNIICLSCNKNKSILLNINITLTSGTGKIFYKNLLDLDFVNSINISYNTINLLIKNNNLINLNIYIDIKPNNIKKLGNSCGLAVFIALFTLILKIKIKKKIAASGTIDNNINLISTDKLKNKLNFYKADIQLIILPKSNKLIKIFNTKIIYVNNIKNVINLIMGI